jgi:hypothetical protein
MGRFGQGEFMLHQCRGLRFPGHQCPSAAFLCHNMKSAV